MKRIIMILITAGAALIISNPTNAQGYYTTTSYSYSYNDWELPHHVRSVVTQYYGGCGIVNARSYYVGGHLSYNLFLTTGNSYVEIEVDRFGYVTRRLVYSAYPTNHVWINNYSVYYKPRNHHHGSHGYHGNNAYHKNHHGHKTYTTNNYYVDYSSKKSNSSGYNSNNSHNNTQRRESVNNSREKDNRVTQRTQSTSNNQRVAKKDVQNSRFDRNITTYAQNNSRSRQR